MLSRSPARLLPTAMTSHGSRMLDRVIETWRERRFARILAVEHARAHELPVGISRRSFDDTSVTVYAL
jgi:hypothetical protein